MWERQYEHGRWNGHQLNILTTSLDGGKRLHVSEIPYADLPHIKVMGSKSSTFSITVVFVGASSLARANAFIAAIELSPCGQLEHPWLGELSLVFETYSQSLSTKLGLVEVSLNFIRAGITPTITAPTLIRSKEQASMVESISKKSFVQDVNGMNVSELNAVQEHFKEAVNVLVDITNRLHIDNEQLQEINESVNEALDSVSGIANDPLSFAEKVSNAVNAVSNGVQSESGSQSEAVDNSRSAQNLMLSQVKTDTPSNHYNVQMVTAAVKMSKDLAELEKADSFEVGR